MVCATFIGLSLKNLKSQELFSFLLFTPKMDTIDRHSVSGSIKSFKDVSFK